MTLQTTSKARCRRLHSGAALPVSSPKPKLSGLHIFPRTRGTVKINVRLPTVPWTRRISDCPFLPRNFLITLIGRGAPARALTYIRARGHATPGFVVLTRPAQCYGIINRDYSVILSFVYIGLSLLRYAICGGSHGDAELA